MKTIQRISRISKKAITCKECDYRDVINEDNRFLRYKEWEVGRILRSRTKHITCKVDSHPKSQIVYGMAAMIYFEMMKIIVEELFNRNTIRLKNIGDIRLETRPIDVKYKGWSVDWKRAKRNGFYTMIKVEYKVKQNAKYGYPYWAFGEQYKKRLHQLEDKGIKY
jgi:hypothetical protein